MYPMIGISSTNLIILVPLTRISLRVFVVHTGTQSLENRSAGKVLWCDELQTVRLPVLLIFYDGKHLKHKYRIISGDSNHLMNKQFTEKL